MKLDCSTPTLSPTHLYNTKLHHPMNRDYGSSYDPKLVDRDYVEIVYSKIDKFCLKLSLLHFLHSPIRDYCHHYVQLFDILIYNLKIYEYFVETKPIIP